MRSGILQRPLHDDLFHEYVNYFLSLKQESSGYPDWVKTPEDQARYIDDYFKHEGILLRKEKKCEKSRVNSTCEALFKLFVGKIRTTYR